MTASENDSDFLSDPSKWVDHYGSYLYNYAYSRLHNRSAAEDVVQETFLAALKGRKNFAGESSERTWLTGILRHKIIDHLRRIYRDNPEPEGETSPGAGAFRESGRWKGHWNPDRSPADWGDSPERFLESEEFYRVLDECIALLSARTAAAFVLYQMEEISSDEVCKLLSVTPTNLWVMLHRARTQLRQCLERNWIGRKD
ncbi:MAG TPA: sigma-70 family RNA polymerase sigma factor [candidate division Zixibacteria bacterium]|nr:sigma-70 family RNA polymerase sigma factor [candidate division Zixibacteria bacterium]